MIQFEVRMYNGQAINKMYRVQGRAWHENVLKID